jgi:hypothetical protein
VTVANNNILMPPPADVPDIGVFGIVGVDEQDLTVSTNFVEGPEAGIFLRDVLFSSIRSNTILIPNNIGV